MDTVAVTKTAVHLAQSGHAVGCFMIAPGSIYKELIYITIRVNNCQLPCFCFGVGV
jgi:hypothetical protein